MAKFLGLVLGALAVGCGGGNETPPTSPCSFRSGQLTFRATLTETMGEREDCAALPVSFTVYATASERDASGHWTFSGTENGQPFSAAGFGASSDCYFGASWNDRLYAINFERGSYLQINKLGQCVGTYSLR